MRLASLLIFTVLIAFTTSCVWATPLVTDPGNQMEPDVYGHYVVYMDDRYRGALGCGVMLYDLTSGVRTLLNPTQSSDNRPAIGGNRVAWCDRRWNGRGIVSTVIGSGVENVILQTGASAFGVDVNDRWAIWYHFWADGKTVIRTYRFASSSLSFLEITEDRAGYYDVSVHLDHFSDRVMLRTSSGSYQAIDLATGIASSSTAAEYDQSAHAYYNGCRVWEEDNGFPTGRNIHILQPQTPPTEMTIGAAKLGQNAVNVSLPGKVVTATFQGGFYAEEPNRFSAVRVVSGVPVSVGDTVDIVGKTNVSQDEAEILADSVLPAETPHVVIPLGMSNQRIGGGGQGRQCGVTGGTGQNNTGLLVCAFGRVTITGAGYLYIDDGSDLRDGTLTGAKANLGLRIICDPAGCNPGDFLMVTGISSFFSDTGGVHRRILTRGASDIVPIKRAAS